MARAAVEVPRAHSDNLTQLDPDLLNSIAPKYKAAYGRVEKQQILTLMVWNMRLVQDLIRERAEPGPLMSMTLKVAFDKSVPADKQALMLRDTRDFFLKQDWKGSFGKPVQWKMFKPGSPNTVMFYHQANVMPDLAIAELVKKFTIELPSKYELDNGVFIATSVIASVVVNAKSKPRQRARKRK